jgi:hypothetical protein
MSKTCSNSFSLTVAQGVTLVSYWKLDETTGNRLDSQGGNHLVPAGANSFAAGKISNALSFGTTEAEIRKTGISGGLLAASPFTICGWYQKTGVPLFANFIFLSFELYNGSHTLLWRASLRYTSAGALSFQFGLGASGDAITTITPSVGAWYFFRLWLGTDQKIHAQFNEGVKYNGTVTIGSVPATTTSEIVFGPTPVYSLLLDEVGLYSGEMNDASATALYNSGNGNTYPNVPGV